MGDLKPCPFCGSTDLRLNEFAQYAICNSCNAFGPSFDIVDECDALAAWNTRAAPPEVTALVEALRIAEDYLDWGRDRRALDAIREARSKWEAAQK